MTGGTRVRVDQMARVERIAAGLTSKCLERGATVEEVLMGLLAACVSCRPDEHRPAQIEWIRTILDLMERDLLARAGGQWKR